MRRGRNLPGDTSCGSVLCCAVLGPARPLPSSPIFLSHDPTLALILQSDAKKIARYLMSELTGMSTHAACARRELKQENFCRMLVGWIGTWEPSWEVGRAVERGGRRAGDGGDGYRRSVLMDTYTAPFSSSFAPKAHPILSARPAFSSLRLCP